MKDDEMVLVGFKNTHDQEILINPDQVAYVIRFEDAVTVIAFALPNSAGQPTLVYVRGSLEQVKPRLIDATPQSSDFAQKHERSSYRRA